MYSYIAKGIEQKHVSRFHSTKSPNQVKGSAKWQDQKSMPLRDQNCLLRPDQFGGAVVFVSKQERTWSSAKDSVDGKCPNFCLGIS